MDMIIHGKTRDWWTNGQSSYQIFSLGKYKTCFIHCGCILSLLSVRTYFRMSVHPLRAYVGRLFCFFIRLLFYIGVAPIWLVTHVHNKNNYIQRSLNVIKLIFHTIRNCSRSEFFPLREVPI